MSVSLPARLGLDIRGASFMMQSKMTPRYARIIQAKNPCSGRQSLLWEIKPTLCEVDVWQCPVSDRSYRTPNPCKTVIRKGRRKFILAGKGDVTSLLEVFGDAKEALQGTPIPHRPCELRKRGNSHHSNSGAPDNCEFALPFRIYDIWTMKQVRPSLRCNVSWTYL